MSDSNNLRDAFRYSSAGIEIVVIVIIFLYGGYRLDGKLGTLPVFTLVGSVLGMVIGFYVVFRTLIADNSRGKDDIGKKP